MLIFGVSSGGVYPSAGVTWASSRCVAVHKYPAPAQANRNLFHFMSVAPFFFGCDSWRRYVNGAARRCKFRSIYLAQAPVQVTAAGESPARPALANSDARPRTRPPGFTEN